MSMEKIDKLLRTLEICLTDSELEHIFWKFFLDSRNLYGLELRKIWKLLEKNERVNEEGRVIEFNKPRFENDLYASSVHHSFNLSDPNQVKQLEIVK